jgi:predicted ArsR family transcriptional regulator
LRDSDEVLCRPPRSDDDDHEISILAHALGITEVGVRQHLAKLHGEGLVAFDDQAGEVGRPKRMWRLTAKGHARFPDTHGDLTVSLIEGIRSVFGEAGLNHLIEARQEAGVATYRQALEPYRDLGDRVGVLARLRTVEGYMAEFEMQGDGSFLLIENHCPICAAAKTCQGFFRSELELFQVAFGAEMSVTRQAASLSIAQLVLGAEKASRDQAGRAPRWRLLEAR